MANLDYGRSYSERIRDAASRFPSVFGLKDYPGKIFRVNEQKSMANGQVYLAVEQETPAGWIAFGKANPAELKMLIVAARSTPSGRFGRF